MSGSSYSWVAGKYGNALKLSSGNYATVGKTGLPAGKADRTISLWIYPYALNVSNQEIFFYGAMASGKGIFLGTGATGATNKFLFCVYSELHSVATTPLVTNAWQHLAVTISNSGQAKCL